jgi:hypothetical protein
MTLNYKTFAGSPPPEASSSQNEEASSLSQLKKKFQETDRYAKMLMYCRRGALFLIGAILIAVTIFVPVTRAQHHHRDTSDSSSVLYEPILPPSYPLAVRNPYLSAWIPGPLISNISSANAQFWAGQNLIWSVIARVDNVTYNLFGVATPGSGTKYGVTTSAKYTATHSVFNITAGDVSFGLDFFSPVSTGNYLRQSLPFSNQLPLEFAYKLR